MYKNWSALCNEPDYLLKLLVATTSNSDTLRGLEAGFPHLFTEREQTEPRMPYSVLCEVYRNCSAKKEDGYCWIGTALDSVNFPHFVLGSGDVDPIPSEWKNSSYTSDDGDGMLMLQGIRPKTVNYKGEECAILEYPSDFHFIVIAPTRFIDMDA